MFDLNSNILTAHMQRLKEERERVAEPEQRLRPSRSRSQRSRWRSVLSQALRRWATRIEPPGGAESAGG